MQIDIGDESFHSFVAAMQRHRVRYMLIGGMAVNFHGFVRNTQDMDIWLAPNNENRDLFYNVLIDLGYTAGELEDFKNEDFTVPDFEFSAFTDSLGRFFDWSSSL